MLYECNNTPCYLNKQQQINDNENNVIFFPAQSSNNNTRQEKATEEPYTKYCSRDFFIRANSGMRCVIASFKIDKLDHEKVEKDKSKVYFLTLPETDLRVGIKKHSKNVDKFFKKAKKIFQIQAYARSKEHNSVGAIHSHFIIISKDMDIEVAQIWKKISGVECAQYDECYYYAGLRQYVCKKNEKNEELIPISEKIKQKFSFSRDFKNYLTEQIININNGYRNIGKMIFSNNSVKIQLLKTKKSKAIDFNFSNFLQPFKETLRFKTNDLYGFIALNEKDNFIKFLNIEEKLLKEKMLYFISINGSFNIVKRSEYFENRLIS